MNNISYHLATTADVRIMADMRIQFLTELVGTQPKVTVELLRASLEKVFKETLENSTYIGWLAKDGDTVIATGGMTIIKRPGSFKNPEGVTGYIMNMFTLPGYRRKGISTALLHKLTDTGHKMGINAFELHATKDGEPVYKQHGFSLHHEPTYRRFDK